MDKILNLLKPKPNAPVEQIYIAPTTIIQSDPEPYIEPEIITHESIQHSIPFIDPMGEIYEASNKNMIATFSEETPITTYDMIYPSTFTGVSQTNFNNNTTYFNTQISSPSPNVGVSSVNTLTGALTLTSSDLNTLSIDTFSANGTIVFNVPSINTGVDSVNSLLGDLTLLSSNVSTLTIDPYSANGTIVFHVPSTVINTGVDTVNSLLGDLTLLSSNVSTLTIDSYSSNSTIVFNVPSTVINTGVDKLNNLLGDITLLSANVSTLSIDTYSGNSTIVLKVPSSTIIPNDDWANFPAINNVVIPNHDFNMTTTTPGVSYNTASLNANFIIGSPTNIPLRPDMTAYCGTVTLGGLTTPLTGMTINSLGTVNINSVAGLSLLGGGGISIAGAGSITAAGSTITLGAGVVSALGGSIDLGGGTITMAGGVINALGTAVNVGGGLITATTGGLLVTAGSVVVGTSTNAGAGMVCYGGKIQTYPSITGGGGGLEMNNCPITGVSTINGAAYPPVIGASYKGVWVSGTSYSTDDVVGNPQSTLGNAINILFIAPINIPNSVNAPWTVAGQADGWLTYANGGVYGFNNGFTATDPNFTSQLTMNSIQGSPTPTSIDGNAIFSVVNNNGDLYTDFGAGRYVVAGINSGLTPVSGNTLPYITTTSTSLTDYNLEINSGGSNYEINFIAKDLKLNGLPFDVGVSSFNSATGAIDLVAADGIDIQPITSTSFGVANTGIRSLIVGSTTLNNTGVTLVGGSGISLTPSGGNTITINNPVYQATYYKSAQQNLVNPDTDITFDLTGSWNNDGGYITHVNGTKDFTVVQTGLYQLEFNISINANGATWNTGVNKTVSIDITRTTEQAVIQNSQSVANSISYQQSVSTTYYLIAGDVINLRSTLAYASATPFAVGFLNVFDLNTFFNWRYVSSGGALAYQNPPPIIQAAGTNAIIPTSANTTYILTSGTIQNFTTSGLGAGNAGTVWFVKNGSSNDITIQANGVNIAGQTSILHQNTGSNNSSSQILYWSGTTLTMY